MRFPWKKIGLLCLMHIHKNEILPVKLLKVRMEYNRRKYCGCRRWWWAILSTLCIACCSPSCVVLRPLCVGVFILLRNCSLGFKCRPVLHHCIVMFSGSLGSCLVCYLGLKIEFRSCARERQWSGIFHFHLWTVPIKPKLLFSSCKMWFKFNRNVPWVVIYESCLNGFGLLH